MLAKLDAAWAWAPFEPSSERPFNERLAAHLYRRGGFGANPAQLAAAVAGGPASAVAQLLEAEESESERQTAEHLAAAALAGGAIQQGAAAWLHRMISTSAQAREKLTLFWHGHFATGADKVDDLQLMQRQNDLLRTHALERFGDLAQKISRDPAMLIYLDSVTNRKSHPNENYARELMELFCLGEGNYTEDDVLELARCFTGWGVKRRRFKFNPYQHDTAAKLILGQEGPFGGEQAVDIVLQQDAAPLFIAGKLVRYLVADELELTPELLAPLAETFREADLQIAPLVQQILESNLFFSEYAVARKIRSPVEQLVGVLRSLQATTNVVAAAEQLKDVGQGLYYPPNVKGWDGGRAWINTSTLLGRANMMGDVLKNESTRFAGGGLVELVKAAGASSVHEAIDWLARITLATPLSDSVAGQLEQVAGPFNENGLRRGLHAMLSMPQAQIG